MPSPHFESCAEFFVGHCMTSILLEMDADRSMNFIKKAEAPLGSKDNLAKLTANLESLQAARKKENQKKSRLLGKIMNLDVDDEQSISRRMPRLVKEKIDRSERSTGCG